MTKSFICFEDHIILSTNITLIVQILIAHIDTCVRKCTFTSTYVVQLPRLIVEIVDRLLMRDGCI